MACKVCGKRRCDHCKGTENGIHVSVNLDNNQIGCEKCNFVRTIRFTFTEQLLAEMYPDRDPKYNKVTLVPSKRG